MKKNTLANIDLPTADDDVLLREIRKYQSNKAYHVMYCRHHKFVKTEAYYLLKDIDNAENVVQDVFMEIWLKPRVSRNVSLKKHLFNITRRLCKAIRKNKTFIYRDPFSLKATQEPNYDYENLSKKIEKAVIDISKTSQEALRLKWNERKSLKEIADQLELSVDAAKKRVSRALQELRFHLNLPEMYPI